MIVKMIQNLKKRVEAQIEKIQEMFNKELRTSLVVQQLRICLPMQGTQIQSLVWEEPECRGATKPMRHNY